MDDALLTQGWLRVRLASGAEDVARVQSLRYRAFIDPNGHGLDQDVFDPQSQHMLVEDTRSPEHLLCSFRFQQFPSAKAAGAGYTGAVYDLTPLGMLNGPMLELGRFCADPDRPVADALRLAWAGVTKLVDQAGAVLLFGCSSFRGTDPAPFEDAFRALAKNHLPPKALCPGRKAADTRPLPRGPFDAKRAQSQTPPLLRSYLSLGGWVSDHMVVDHEMNTLHVFTGVEVARIPPRRAEALRRLADS